MDNDLISRSALKAALLERSFYPAIVKNALENAPAVDAVEVVRCKDCKNWMYEYDDVGLCTIDVPDIDGVQRYASDFCSYGDWRADNGMLFL